MPLGDLAFTAFTRTAGCARACAAFALARRKHAVSAAPFSQRLFAAIRAASVRSTERRDLTFKKHEQIIGRGA